MSSRPLYIFDLDGTLADCKHRLHYVKRPSSVCPRCEGIPFLVCTKCNNSGRVYDRSFGADWDAFFKACVDDVPIPSGIFTFNVIATSR